MSAAAVLNSSVFIHIVLHTHTHPFNGPLSRTTRVSRYQKGKTNLDFTEARDSESQWHQLGHMQVCTLLQTDNHASTPPLRFLQARCLSCRPTNSVKALKAISCCIHALKRLQSNPLKWIALGPDYEYPLIPYVVSKLDQTYDIHLSGLST